MPLRAHIGIFDVITDATAALKAQAAECLPIPVGQVSLPGNVRTIASLSGS